jgi:hypothetical protein
MQVKYVPNQGNDQKGEKKSLSKGKTPKRMSHGLRSAKGAKEDKLQHRNRKA